MIRLSITTITHSVYAVIQLLMMSLLLGGIENERRLFDPNALI